MADVPDILREHADELEAEASKRDAKPGVVILAAIAQDEEAPGWALERLEDRI